MNRTPVCPSVRRWRVCAAALAIGLAPAAGAQSSGGSFSILPSLVSNYEVAPHEVSGDGRVVVGWASRVPPGTAFGITAAAWHDGSAFNLGQTGFDETHAWRANQDGSVAVGWGIDHFGRAVPLKFTGGQMIPLADPASSAAARGVSADGAVIVGFVANRGFQTTPTGLAVLNPLPGHLKSYANSVSGDGLTVVGTSATDDGLNMGRAVLWRNQIIQPLPYLPGFTYRSEAIDASGDGNTIAGWCMSSSVKRACLWTGNSALDLGALPVAGTPASQALFLSADGSIALGVSGHTTSTQGDIGDRVAFIWRTGRGMVSLQSYLTTELGFNLAGWRLDDVRGISDDGRVMAGLGYDPSGGYRPWVVTVPSGGTPGVVLSAALLVARRRRPTSPCTATTPRA